MSIVYSFLFSPESPCFLETQTLLVSFYPVSNPKLSCSSNKERTCSAQSPNCFSQCSSNVWPRGSKVTGMKQGIWYRFSVDPFLSGQILPEKTVSTCHSYHDGLLWFTTVTRTVFRFSHTSLFNHSLLPHLVGWYKVTARWHNPGWFLYFVTQGLSLVANC